MFLNHYQLHEQPFGVTPDPKYTYFTNTHREALASLAYAIEMGSGFAALIAKPGMGKTTLLFRLLDYLQGKARTVFVFHTKCNSVDLLRYILADMKIKYSGKDIVELHALLNEALLSESRAGRSVVVAIDESQNLGHHVLETIRLLSDFETPRRKLLQIILCGQPQLAHKLAHPDLTQLRQRITVLCRLAPLSPQEIAAYIDHRLQVAGYLGSGLFTPEAVQLIAWESRGIPRVINTLCSNALSIGCALGRSRIDLEVVREVLTDLSVDSLIEDMAAPLQVPKATPTDQPAHLPASDIALERDVPRSQTLAAVLEVPGVMPTTTAPDEDACLAPSDIGLKRDATRPQALAGVLPEPTVVPMSAAPYEAALPAGIDIGIQRAARLAEDRAVSAFTVRANRSPHIAQQTAVMRQALKGKGGWLVGAGFLAALGFTLRFGVPETKVSGTRPLIHVSASSSSLPEATTPTHTALSSDKEDDPSMEQHPAKNHPVGADAVVHSVQTNETLGGISVEYFGRYDNEVLHEVEKRNPDLEDPDRIFVGQKVLLPTRLAISTGKNSSEKHVSASIEGKP